MIEPISAVVTTGYFGLFFLLDGYPPVVTFTTRLPVRSPPVYMLPIFFLFGILLGELICLWLKSHDSLKMKIFVLKLCILAGLASIRLLIFIPLSGHTLILAFYLLNKLFTNKFQYRIRFGLGLPMLLLTFYFKIFLWVDLVTYVVGGMGSILIWLAGSLL